MRILITLLLIYNLHYWGYGQNVGFESPNINLNLNKGFDVAYSYVVDETPHLFCYDTHTGKAAFWNMSQSEKPVVSLSIGTNWNFFTVIKSLNYGQLYLLADSEGGKVKIAKDILDIATSSHTNINSGFDNKQWTLTQVIDIGNIHYLFRYSNATGKTILNKIQNNVSQIAPEPIEYILSPNCDNINFIETGEKVYMLKHSISKKNIVIERINHAKFGGDNQPNSNLFEHNERIIYETQNSWSESRIFSANKNLYLLLYNAASGDIQLLQVDESMTHIKSLYKTTWSTGWSNFNVIFIENSPYLFHHKEANGLARISRISI